MCVCVCLRMQTMDQFEHWSKQIYYTQKGKLLTVLGLFLTSLLLLYALEGGSNQVQYESTFQHDLQYPVISDTIEPEDEPFFPSNKCKIKNFNYLKRMSIVYTWVNGSLPCYQESRKAVGGEKSIGGSRDREFGELMYSIRSMQKFMPWHVGNIYIVTPGHIPNWISLNNPRIKVINQDDLFPDYAKEFLPSFNTHVIEQFLYRIPGLSDIFMQINDDYLFTQPIYPHEFFTCDGGIRLLHERGLISHTPPKPTKGIWISSVLNTQQEMDLRWGKEDRHFIKHAPFVYSRRAFERIHQIFDRPLYMTLKSKFRSRPDMNVPLLHHNYMLSQGSKELGIPVESPPDEEMQGFQLVLLQDNNLKNVKGIFDKILSGKHEYKIIALNDEYSQDAAPNQALEFLNKFLPEKSEFELKEGEEGHPVTIRDPDTCEVDPTILSPTPSRIDSPPQFHVVAHREYRWSAFFNSMLRGIGLGLGLMLAVMIYNMLFPGASWMSRRKSSMYDKV